MVNPLAWAAVTHHGRHREKGIHVTAESADLDGRRARRGRNRETVVDALLELFTEGELSPSVAAVAERSGVSLRSVFRYFDDLDEMGRIAIERHTEHVQHLFDLPGIGEGSRDDRVAALVSHRLRLYEAVAPVVRATILRAPFQPVIAETIARRRRYLRAQVDQQFAPELDRLEADDRFAVAAAVDILTSFETAELLFVDRDLSADQAGEVMTGSIDRLLPH
jgi:AcrR family transcriptional regulator